MISESLKSPPAALALQRRADRTAKFAQLPAATVVAKGFGDGGNVWRIRFAQRCREHERGRPREMTPRTRYRTSRANQLHRGHVHHSAVSANREGEFLHEVNSFLSVA